MFTSPAKTTDVTITGNVDARTTESSVFTVNFLIHWAMSIRLLLHYSMRGVNGQNVEYTIAEGTVTKNGEKTNIILDTSSGTTFII